MSEALATLASSSQVIRKAQASNTSSTRVRLEMTRQVLVSAEGTDRDVELYLEETEQTEDMGVDVSF